eukprot:g6123.t1
MTLGPVSDTRVNKVTDFASTLRNSAGPTTLRHKKRASLNRQSAGRRKSKEITKSSSRTSASRSSKSRNSHSRSSKGKNSSRRQSSVHGYGGSAIEDPRPINDSAFMNTEQRVLIGYLVEKNYDHQISPRTLTHPTGKDFEHICSFLFRQIDRNFKFQKSMVNEVPLMFKGLHYPFSISKTALSAVGSPHTWPYLLACLTWLIELLGYDEESEKSKAENKVAEFEFDAGGNLVFFEYLREAYGFFLAGDDEHYENLESELEGKIQDQNKAFTAEVDKIKEENEFLKKELAILENNATSVPKLKSKQMDLKSDLQKFHKLISQLSDHIKSQEEKLSRRQSDLKIQEEELKQAEEEAKNLRVKFNSQELSAADVEKMAKRREQVKNQIASLENLIEKKLGNVKDAEEDMDDAVKQLSTMVGTYNEKALDLKLVPVKAKNSDGKDLKLILNENDVDLFNISPKHVIKPILKRLQDHYKHKMQDEKAQATELGGIVEAGNTLKKEKSNEVEELKLQASKLEDNLRREKETMDLCVKKGQEEAEEYELRIHKLRHEPHAHVERLKSDLIEAKSIYEDTNANIQQQRSRLASQIESCLNSITNHKFYFENKLTETLEQMNMKKKSLLL